MADIAKQIPFICAIYDYPMPSPLSPKSKTLWKSLKTKISRKATDESFPRKISTLEKRFIQDCVNAFYIRVKTLKSCFVIQKDLENPHADILDTACKVFIGCFNSYLSNMDGLYVEKYGVVKVHDLKIETVSAFSKLLEETVNLGFLPKKIQEVAKTYLSIMHAPPPVAAAESADSAGTS